MSPARFREREQRRRGIVLFLPLASSAPAPPGPSACNTRARKVLTPPPRPITRLPPPPTTETKQSPTSAATSRRAWRASPSPARRSGTTSVSESVVIKVERPIRPIFSGDDRPAESARTGSRTPPSPFHTPTQKKSPSKTKKNQIKKKHEKKRKPGWRYHLRRPSAWFGVFALGTAAVAHGMQQSAARLMGVIPNDAEVERHLEARPGK